jgi:ribonuclease P protein component
VVFLFSGVVFFAKLSHGMGVLSINTVALKKNFEFKRIYKKGRSFVNPAIVVYILKNNKAANRVGITTSRKVGNAVMRNRARRVIREAYRQLEDRLHSGFDIVFVARTKTCLLKEQDIFKAMNGIFISAKLLDAKTAKLTSNNISS